MKFHYLATYENSKTGEKITGYLIGHTSRYGFPVLDQGGKQRVLDLPVWRLVWSEAWQGAE